MMVMEMVAAIGDKVGVCRFLLTLLNLYAVAAGVAGTDVYLLCSVVDLRQVKRQRRQK